MQWIDSVRRALSAGAAFRTKKVAGGRPSAHRRRLAFEALEPRLPLSAAGLVPVGTQPTGTLSGKIVFTSAGHGIEYEGGSVNNGFLTDRPDYSEIVEDWGNQDQLTFYADYLLRAGATVVPMRPIGRQINQVVLDNDSPGVTFTAGWSNSSSTKYYDEDYGAVTDAIPYRFASTTTGTETAVATYTPNIASAGFYPVYTWVLYGTDRTVQTYRINHTGGATEINVDHSKVGSGWVYLGTYHFNAGSSSTLGSVQIINKAPVTGKVVIADAIRFGNGMGDYVESGAPGPSGYPREDESSYYWIARSVGVGTSLATAIGSGTTNVSAPSNMAQYLFHGSFGEAVYVGFHSNGTTGDPATATARGAVGLIDSTSPTPNQSSLASYLGNQINQDMQNLNGVFEYNWTTGTTATYTSGFGEIDLGSSAEMDATIIEVAFHDNTQDNALLRDPKARDQIARSVYQGTLQYFATFGNPIATNTSLPTAPTNVRAVSNASGAVTINWSAGPTSPSSVNGAAATGFRIYASVDGYGFDGGTFVSGGGTTSATLTGFDPTAPYYFRVVAVNAGGESKPSEVVTVLPSGGVKQVLIVNGFDRYGRDQNFRYPYYSPAGNLVDRVWPGYNNSFDYVVQTHSAINASKPGIHVASTSNEAVISGAVNLTDYDSVIWILGTESTANDTFDATEQSKVTSFINAGGNLFLSGSEIAWDLDQQNNGRTFYENTLKGNYVFDSAGTNTATADAGGIFAGMSSFAFSTGSAFSQLDSQVYKVDSADVIAPQSGAVSALTYSGGTGGAAAIQVPGTGGKGSIVMFGFPFEAMTDATRRQNAMGHILDFFGLAAPAPAIDIKTRVNGQDADAPTGPILAAGATASFTYVVTNAGNVPLSGLAVKDNNGTPANTADDFTPTFSGGDTNGNSQLDVGETWTYTASRVVTAGQYTNIGSVTATGNAQSVSDSDSANHFGAAPGINVVTSVNGQDANSPPGPTLTAGDTGTFTYIVTNTGNMAVGSVVVTDDNGTLGNTADDFNPAYASGDTNSNSQLDLGESWTYTAARNVIAGQYTNIGSTTGQDSIGQNVSDGDAANYFGVVPENADFNGDNIVDAADFVIWRSYENTSVPAGTLGDANFDGQVNATDYQIWRDQFGTSPGAGSAAATPISAPAATSNSEDSTAVRHVLFDAMVPSESTWRVGRRPALVPHELSVATTLRSDWAALVAAIADRPRDGDDADLDGKLPTHRRETESDESVPAELLAELPKVEF